jgi:hypothetical protein
MMTGQRSGSGGGAEREREVYGLKMAGMEMQSVSSNIASTRITRVFLLGLAGALILPHVTFSQKNYFPLAPGNYWDYGSVHREVVGDTALPDGRKYAFVRESHYGQVTVVRQVGDTVFSGLGDQQVLYDFSRKSGDTLWKTTNQTNILLSRGDTLFWGRLVRWWSFRRLFAHGGYEFDVIIDSLGLAEYGENSDVGWSSQSLRGAFIDGKRLGVIEAVQVEGNVPDPSGFMLHQNYPNPFNPTTRISYTIGRVVAPSASKGRAGTDGAARAGSGLQAVSRENIDATTPHHIQLTLYDLLGREVAVLVDGVESPGWHEVVFDGKNLPSGTYFYFLRSGSTSIVRKCVLMK